MERIIERPGALDVHKESVMACVRVWEGRELEEHIAEFHTTVQGLLALRRKTDISRTRSGFASCLRAEQLSNVVDETVKDHQAATLSFVVVSSSSVTLMPSLNVAPSSSSLTSSAPLSIRQRSWAASSSL